MQDLTSVIAAIYAAVPDPDAWQGALERLRDVFHTDVGSLILQDVAGGQGARVQIGYDPAGPSYADYAAINPLFRRIVGKPVGVAQSDQTLVDRDELIRSVFFNEYALPHRLYHYMGLPIDRHGEDLVWLSMCRAPGRDPFGPAELVEVQSLAPHLRCAVEASRRLGEARTVRTAAETVLDALLHAVVMLDQRGRLAMVNEAARRLAGTRDGFTIRAGTLHAGTTEQDATLQALIARAARGTARTGGHVATCRPSGKPALSMLVVPLPTESAWNLASAPAVAVLISDPARVVRPSADALRTIFALTRREAELAALLAVGQGLQVAAEQLGIGRETARTHLGRVLDKTGVKRQSELVRLLLSLAPGIYTTDDAAD